jgi:hypothetical protein
MLPMAAAGISSVSVPNFPNQMLIGRDAAMKPAIGAA